MTTATNKRSKLGQLADIDIRLLRIFKSVVECGGMSAAELELNIGTSTVSRHIKDLEIRLGLSLCRRGRAGFSLTAEGSQIYAQTLLLLNGVDAFRSSVDDIHNRMGGELHIAVFDKTASNPLSHLDESIALFVERAPEVNLHVHVASINIIERGVIDDQFQLGIIPGHRHSDIFTYDQLFDETMHLYCGQAHPLFKKDNKKLTWTQLRGFPFAGLGYHSPNMEITQQVRITRSATGYDQEAIATLILSGKYLGFLPDHYAQTFVERRLLHALNPDLFKYQCQFFAIVRRSPLPSRVASLFKECLQATHDVIPG